MEALHKIRRVVDLVLSSACAVIFAAMVVIGSYQIITRFIFKSPSTVSEELLTYSFTWMALMYWENATICVWALWRIRQARAGRKY